MEEISLSTLIGSMENETGKVCLFFFTKNFLWNQNFCQDFLLLIIY